MTAWADWDFPAMAEPGLRGSIQAAKSLILDDPRYDRDLVLVERVAGKTCALAVAVSGDPAHVKLLLVDPPLRGRGIGSHLLAQLEQRLAARDASRIRIAESAPCYLFPGVPASRSQAVAFFQQRGYERIGEAVNMNISTSLSKQTKPTNLHVRRAQLNDLSTLRDFVAAHWPGWVFEVAGCFANQPVSLWSAWDGSRPVGFAAHGSPSGLAWRFGPTATLPEYRGRGIGTALLQRCLADMKRAGLSQVEISWVGPQAFYQQLGAEVSARFVRLEKRIGAYNDYDLSDPST